MELAKLLLKVLYIILVYVIIFLFLSSYDPTLGRNAMVIAFLASVIIMYFTFNLVYNFLVSSELIFAVKKTDETTTSQEEEDEDEEVTTSPGKKILINNSLKIDKKRIQNILDNYKVNHSHQYLQDEGF
tara:strand:+ start:4 stop:390 length:387 start_codon:yes stop_codon:yes gene_type:complete